MFSKRLILTLAFLGLIIGESHAQSIIGASPGVPVTAVNAEDLTAATGDSPFDYSLVIGTNGASAVTWQTIYSAAPTTITVLLEGSTDCSTFNTLDTSTNNAGEIRSVFGSFKCLRINNTAVTGGAGKTLTVKIVYSTGRMVGSGSGVTTYTGGTFSGPILLPDGTAAAPSLAFASNTGMGIYKIATGLVVTSNPTPYFYFDTANNRVQLRFDGEFTWTSGSVLAAADLKLTRDASNTLALRNSTNPQTFNIYNTYTDGSNYEGGKVGWVSDNFDLITTNAGSGTPRQIRFGTANNPYWFIRATTNGAAVIGTLAPVNAEGVDIGQFNVFVRNMYVARAIQGFKTKTIADASATAFVRLALTQGLGANFTSGYILWHLHCDNGSVTTYADRTGETVFSCNNISGTEACVFDSIAQQVTQAATYSFAAPAFTATGGTDTVDINVNADCGGVAGPTNMYIHYRLNILDPQTVTPL